MNENVNVEELLNSYIDGELSQRHETEVKRLLRNDPEIAKRLRELERCKMLVSSLPSDDAPESMLGDIKATLERRALLGAQPELANQRLGRMHLLFRKVVSAAAMIALVGGLAIVVYTIVAPQGEGKSLITSDNTFVITEQPQPAPEEVVIEQPSVAVDDTQKPLPGTVDADAGEFNGRLELKTNNPIAVAAVIKRAIDDNGLFAYSSLASQENENIYKLSCSREGLGLLLADLENIWGRFDSTTLFVETDQQAEQIVVSNVEAGQIVEIINQDSPQKYTQAAKGYAVLNELIKSSAGQEILTAIDSEKPQLTTIPKPIPMPVLTSGEKTIKRLSQSEDEQKVNLTIVIINSK